MKPGTIICTNWKSPSSKCKEKLDIGEESLQPWLVDRLLRNLLIDLTGNTHRAEFCIDKLYSPDSATGRLGLGRAAGLRNAAALPHELAAIACCCELWWRDFGTRRYQGKLVYWDTALHDRFMLPHFIEQDMRDICRDLQNAGFPFDEAWFAPFLEFRFPRYGSVVYEGVQHGIAASHRALACVRRGSQRRRNRPLCRFLRGAPADKSQRHDRQPSSG